MIRFECPGCRAVYTVPDADAGKTGRCPACGGEYVIPAAPEGGPGGPVEVAPCPGCGVRLSVAPADLGTAVECPYCRAEFAAVRAGPADRPDRRPARDDDPADADRPRVTRALVDDGAKPGGIGSVGGMLLGGGIYAMLHSLGAVGGTGFVCCLWPGVWLAVVWAILAVVRGSQMLGSDDPRGPPRTLLILQILLILNADVVNCVLGVIGLSILGTPEVERYYRRRG